LPSPLLIKEELNLTSKSFRIPKKVIFLNSLHPAQDIRLFYKEAYSLAKKGFFVKIFGPYKRHNFSYNNIEIFGIGISRSRLVTLIRLFRYGLRSHADIIQSNELDSWLVGIMISILCRIPVIFDAHEFYPQRNIQNRSWLVKKWFPIIIRFVMRCFSVFTDQVITVSSRLAMEYSFLKCPVITIYNYAVQQPLTSRSREDLIRDYPNYPILIHTGLINQDKGINNILSGLKVLKKTYPKVLCLIIGKNGDPPAMQQKIQVFIDSEELRENVEFIKWSTYDQIPRFLKCANIGLIMFDVTNYNNKIGFPQKFFEYLMAGLLVIVPRGSELEKIVEVHQNGIAISPKSPEEFAWAVENLVDKLQKFPGLRERIKDESKIKFNWKQESEKYVNLYMKMIYHD